MAFFGIWNKEIYFARQSTCFWEVAFELCDLMVGSAHPTGLNYSLKHPRELKMQSPKLKFLLLVMTTSLCVVALPSCKKSKSTSPIDIDTRTDALIGLWHAAFVDDNSGNTYEILLQIDSDYTMRGKWCDFGSFEHAFDPGSAIDKNSETEITILDDLKIHYHLEASANNLTLVSSTYDDRGVLQNTETANYDKVLAQPTSCALKNPEVKLLNLSPTSAVSGTSVNIEFNYKYHLITDDSAVIIAEATVANGNPINIINIVTLEYSPDASGNIVDGIAKFTIDSADMAGATALRICFGTEIYSNEGDLRNFSCEEIAITPP